MGARHGRFRRARELPCAVGASDRGEGNRGRGNRSPRRGRPSAGRALRHQLSAAGSDRRGDEANRRPRRRCRLREYRRSGAFPESLRRARPRGRLITAGGHGGGTVPLSIFNLYVKGITIFGSTEQTDEDMVMSLKAAAEGHLRALIDQVLPLADAAKAHEIVEGRGGTGKVLLAPG